jgi:hypothetical protein
MYDWRIVNMAQEHCNDLLREAEQERLARQALQGRGPRGSLYCRALLRLGLWLAALGARLQAHYGASSAVPGLRATR